jgi:hypothetical protein
VLFETTNLILFAVLNLWTIHSVDEKSSVFLYNCTLSVKIESDVFNIVLDAEQCLIRSSMYFLYCAVQLVERLD